MFIVRKGGTITLPKGEDSADIHEALLLMDAGDPKCWDNGQPRLVVVNWLVGLIRREKKSANVSKAAVAAVHQVMQPKAEEKEQTDVNQ